MLKLLILAALGAGAYYAYKKYMSPQGATGAMSEPDEMYDAAAIHRDADQAPAGGV